MCPAGQCVQRRKNVFGWLSPGHTFTLETPLVETDFPLIPCPLANSCASFKMQKKERQYKIFIGFGATETLIFWCWEYKIMQSLWKTVWKFLYIKHTITLCLLKNSLKKKKKDASQMSHLLWSVLQPQGKERFVISYWVPLVPCTGYLSHALAHHVSIKSGLPPAHHPTDPGMILATWRVRHGICPSFNIQENDVLT